VGAFIHRIGLVSDRSKVSDSDRVPYTYPEMKRIE